MREKRFCPGVAMAMCMAVVIAGVVLVPPAHAGKGGATKKKEYVIEIINHRFVPDEIVVPAGRKVKLRIINRDVTPEEFESYELNREKIVSGKGKIIVFIGPLKAGKYPFFGEFNPKTAQGVIIARTQGR